MSLLCPIDFRYGRPKMKGLFAAESRLQRRLDVDAGLARADAEVGLTRDEPAPHGDRLREATRRVVVGKMSGAGGTGAAFGPYALDIQPAVIRDLGVGMEEAATQVVRRDRYAELIAVLANLAASLEKFCTE